ncbi:hypothetical protein NNO_0034 [Hydrogenimonas sp.]|nr:hypothetical protein NNO_0034 [Hydrogenimonas sp.]
MDLELKSYYEKALEKGLDESDALKDALKKSIEAAVHLYGDSSAGNLSETLCRSLAKELEELDKRDEEVLQYAFERLIETVQKPKEKEIERLIIEIDRLQRHLNTEEEELQRNLRELFIGIERAAEAVPAGLKELWKEALENTELSHVEGLGILTETIEAALVAALEEADDIESAIREVVRQVTHKALGEGILGAARIRAILTTILMKSSELAEATPNHAKEIIHGTVYGINDALISAVKQLKNRLHFAPEEQEAGYVNWNEMIRMLSRSDELYKEIINDVASKNSPFVKDILLGCADVIGDQFAELKRISTETIEIAKKRLSILAKEAVIKGTELKEQLTSEARKLGQKAWKKALDMAEAYKGKR